MPGRTVEAGRVDPAKNRRRKDGLLTAASLLQVPINRETDRRKKSVVGHVVFDKAAHVKDRFMSLMGHDTGHRLLGDKPLDSYRLPQELARLRPELDRRREQYFTTVDGERRIDLDHADFAQVRQYGNEVLNGERLRPDGTYDGLRVRARERNQSNEEMMRLTDMPFEDLVAYAIAYEPLHKQIGSQEYLLPRDYATATAGKKQWGKALFYHDAPMLVEGILASDIKDRVDYAKGMVEALIFEMYVFNGMIPNGSSRKLDGRSQPPSLTRMGMRIYKEMLDSDDYTPQEALSWLGLVMDAAAVEFSNYWKNTEEFHHTVEGLELITAGALDTGSHDMSMRETGNDTDPAHMDRAHDFLDPKLNGELIRYAWDIANYKSYIGDQEAADKWKAIGDKMAEQMIVMYDGEIYRLRDVRDDVGHFSEVASLNGFMPMSNVVLPEEHVETSVAHLDEFTGPYGVAHDVPDTVPLTPTSRILRRFPRGMRPTIKNLFRKHQWGGSNEPGKEDGITEWPIDTHGLIKGLARYGYVDKAIDIAEQWLLGYTEYFNENGTLPEKRNVITGANGHGVEYPQQTDFGWSISNYLWVLKELPKLYKLKEQSKAGEVHTLAPYDVVFEAAKPDA